MELPSESTHGPIMAGDSFVFDGQKFVRSFSPPYRSPFDPPIQTRGGNGKTFWKWLKGLFIKPYFSKYQHDVLKNIAKTYGVSVSELTKSYEVQKSNENFFTIWGTQVLTRCSGNCGMNYCDENGCAEPDLKKWGLDDRDLNVSEHPPHCLCDICTPNQFL